MNKSQLKYAARGEDSMLLVWQPAGIQLEEGSPELCMAIPVLQREGGFLLAIPMDYIAAEAVLEATMGEDEGILGPSRDFKAQLLEEDPDGGPDAVQVGVPCSYLIVDLLDSAMGQIREYDPVIGPSANIAPFATAYPEAVVDVAENINQINEWITSLGAVPRLNFYSAREEQEPPPKAPAKKAAAKKMTTAVLAARVETMANQLQLMLSQQDAILRASQAVGSATHAAEPGQTVIPARSSLPPVSQGLGVLPNGPSKAAQLIGPPPKAKHPSVPSGTVPAATRLSVLDATVAEDSSSVLGQALFQQSSALTALVAHLSQGDAMIDLSSGSSQGVSLSTKGVGRREKMQRDLAEGTSCYFMQVQQQMFKKMFPSKPIPKTEAELTAAGVTMTSYLERYGGFRGQRENAMVMWLVAHIMDAGASADYHLMKEYAALLAASLEQATLDHSWSIAFVLAFLEEPPSQMFAEKGPQVSSLGRPFAGLVPPSWAATALAYMKEVELLTNKKTESKATRNTPKADDDSQSPSPKRRPKFPKKPKQGGEEILLLTEWPSHEGRLQKFHRPSQAP